VAGDGLGPIGAADVLDVAQSVVLDHLVPSQARLLRSDSAAVVAVQSERDRDALRRFLQARIPALEARAVDAASAVEEIVAEPAVENVGHVAPDDLVVSGGADDVFDAVEMIRRDE